MRFLRCTATTGVDENRHLQTIRHIADVSTALGYFDWLDVLDQ